MRRLFRNDLLQIALAWLMAYRAWIETIANGCKVLHLRVNAGAIDVILSLIELCKIDAAFPGVAVERGRIHAD